MMSADVKQAYRKRIGRRPRPVSRSFNLKVLRASTAPIDVTWEVNHTYSNHIGADLAHDIQTIQFSRSINNLQWLGRCDSAISDNYVQHSYSHATAVAPKYLIENSSSTCTITNTSNQHVTVHVYDVIPREDTQRYTITGSTVPLAGWDEHENTMALFRNYRTSNTGEVPPAGIPLPTAYTNTPVLNVDLNTLVDPAKQLPINYGPLQVPMLVQRYKFSKPRVVTLAPNGIFVASVKMNTPKIFDPNRTNPDSYQPYDLRRLTKTVFVRVIPSVHPANQTAESPIVNVFDPISVSTRTVNHFRVRSYWENRPIKVNGDMLRVGAGNFVNPTTRTGQTTFATNDASNQGSIAIS